MKSIYTYLHHQFRPLTVKHVLTRLGCPWSTVQRLLRQNKLTLLSFDSQPQTQLLLTTPIFFMDRLHIAGFQPEQKERVKVRQANPINSKDKLEQMLITSNGNVFLINKLNEISTQGDLSPDSNLYSILKITHPDAYISIVHRLDRAVSGTLIVAKNQEAAGKLHLAIQQRDISKVYLAFTVGIPTLESIQTGIEYSSKNEARVGEEGKKARTKLKVVGNHGKMGVVLIRIQQGRKHQIRCHMSQVSQTPILNDCKYHAPRIIPGDKIFLHSFVYALQNNLLGPGLQGEHHLGRVLVKQDRLFIVSRIPGFWGVEGEQAAKLEQKALAFAEEQWQSV